VDGVEIGVAITDLAEIAGADLDVYEAAALLTQLSPLVVRAVRLVVGSGSPVAEDAAQEALLEVSRSLPQLKNVAAAPAWPMRIASRVALRTARREARLSLAGRRVEATPDVLADTHPSDVLELKEAFDRLPPRVRATAVLRLYVGLSEVETATALDCSVGTVKSQLHEARRRLSRDLGENPSGSTSQPCGRTNWHRLRWRGSKMRTDFPHARVPVSDDDLRAMLTAFEGPSEPALVPRGRYVGSMPRRSVLLVAAALVALVLSVPALAFHNRIGKAIDAVLGNTVFPTPVQGTFADLVANVSVIDRPRGPEDVLTREAADAAAGLGDSLPADAENRSMRVFTAPPAGPVYLLPAKDGFAIITARTGGIVPGTLGKSNPAAGATV
jgi:RNA polymerase sigma factor (sigma-70 family)